MLLKTAFKRYPKKIFTLSLLLAVLYVKAQLPADRIKSLYETPFAKPQWARYFDFPFKEVITSDQTTQLQTQFKIEAGQTTRPLSTREQVQESWKGILIIGLLLILFAAFTAIRIYQARVLETKKALEIQKLLNEHLNEVDKIKLHLITNISHEFRTPLTLILAPLENELKKKNTSEGREGLLLIKKNADRLLELVNQLLDLSKLESGKMELRVMVGDLSRLLVALTSSFDSLAGQKKILFTKKIEIPVRAYWFDRDKIEKIITNLLANAFRFTPEKGSVTISAQLLNDQTVSIAITDTGPGIPKEEQTKIFSPFYQVKKEASFLGGTGLGLSLVKELLKLYNGTITINSSGAGTEFIMTIPAAKDCFSLEQVNSAEDNLKLSVIPRLNQENLLLLQEPVVEAQNSDSILIVEDNADMRQFLATTLTNRDYRVFTAIDGKDALPLAIRHVPDLILSDLMMPNMDGIELTQKVKTDERTCHIPIILLTAKTDPGASLVGLRSGADDYITKPFSPDELVIRIGKLIDQGKKSAEKLREQITLRRASTALTPKDDIFLSKISQIIENNIADFTFTVENLAEEMSLSRTQLLRKVKALTGLTPNDFIKEIRLNRAAYLISNKVDTITQIGYSVGFNDQSDFAKSFKKHFGVAPIDYSRQ